MSALTGNFVSQSYQKLVQISGSYFTDGTGSHIVSSSFANITVTNGTFTNLIVGGSPVAIVSALGAYTTTSSFNSLNSNFTAISASYILVSASLNQYATTGSNTFTGSQSISGTLNVDTTLTVFGHANLSASLQVPTDIPDTIYSGSIYVNDSFIYIMTPSGVWKSASLF
jgi:hypothetical protein